MAKVAMPEQKIYLTIREAANIFGIGENKLRSMIKSGQLDDCILQNGNRTLVHRDQMEKFLISTKSI